MIRYVNIRANLTLVATNPISLLYSVTAYSPFTPRGVVYVRDELAPRSSAVSAYLRRPRTAIAIVLTDASQSKGKITV